MIALHPLPAILAPPDPPRQPTTAVLDAALGGGLPAGAIILLGGAPGAGKSTLLLQAAAALSGAVYLTGEEKLAAIASRAQRLGLAARPLWLGETQSADDAALTLAQYRPPLAVIDSLQTMSVAACKGAPGSPSQLRRVTELFIATANRVAAALVLVCHATKANTLNGPRAIEHIVDTALWLERQPRRLTTLKNRYGPAPLATAFSMTASGTRAVPPGIVVVD